MTAAAVVLAAAGCAKEIEGEIQTPEPQEDEAVTMVIGAELSDSPDADDVTKTLISDNGDKTYSVFWAEGDHILVNGETSSNIDIDKNNKKSASFTLPVVDAPYCAVYPASLYVAGSYNTEKKDTSIIEITIPSTQKYVENGFDPNAAIMTARGEAGGGLAFKHAMAYLKVAVNGTNVKSIRVNGNDNEALSGAYIISYSKSEIAFGPKKNEKGKAIGNTSATISCGESVVASGAPVFIAIPAREYKRGLTLTIVDAENHYQVVRSMKSFTAGMGKVYPTTITFNAAGTYLEGGIYTVEDWNGFVAAVNKGDWSAWRKNVNGEDGVHLMADIYSSTNLPRTNDIIEGSKDKCEWNGDFYGHGHTITHAGTEPLFLHVGKYGKIMDLKVAGERIANTNNGWPGVFVLNNNGEINNCESSVNITLEGNSTNASTICRSNNGKIINCKNTGNITIKNPTAEVKVGGITLYSSGEITGCTNTGTINITGVNVGCVVGGVAYAVSGSAADLHNEGEISIDANLSAVRTIYLGGVIANAEYNGVCSKLSKCSNSGALSIHKKGKFVMRGGAIGGVVAAINAGKKGAEGSAFTGFTNCSNSGNISFVEDETGDNYAYAVGGVVGRCVNVKDVHYLNNGYYTVVRGAVNTGNIKVYTANGQKAALGNSGARQTYVGGIAGYMCGVSSTDKAIVRGKSTCTITTGSALGGDIAGGLVGGGAMLSIDTKPSATTIFKSYEGKPIGFLGAALGWVASKDYVSINGADVTATFELGAVVPVAKGFAGIVNTGKSLTITGCSYQGKAVAATDIYGGGTKTIK